MVLHDITAVAGPDEHSPELRAGLERLGWQVLGRVRLGTEEQIGAFAAEYDPSVAPTVLEKELVGATVLRDADGTTFAFVDWFFTCPFTRLMTLLEDGRLVETHETWTADPLLQTDLQHIHPFMVRRREQTRDQARGRTIELVDEPTPERMVEAHRRHVARVAGESGSAPAGHDTLAGAMDLWKEQHAHSAAVVGRAARVAGFLPTAAVLPLAVALGIRFPADEPLWPLALALLVLMAIPVTLGPFLAVRLFTPLAYVHWYKPRFHGRALDGSRVEDPS